MADNNASSPAAKPAAGPTPTQRDMELIYCAFQCIKDPAIDYKKFAELGGFNSIPSGRASWSAIKRKFFAEPEGGATETTTPKKTPTKGRKRKAATPTTGENAGEADGEAASGSVKKATPRGRKRKTATPPGEGDPETPTKGRAGRRKATPKKTPAKVDKSDSDDDEATASAEAGGASNDTKGAKGAKDDAKPEASAENADDEKNEAEGETAQESI